MISLLQTVIGGLSIGAVYALVAMGFSIVYRTMGLVNFAHADVVMVGAYVTVTFFLTARLPFGVSLLLAVLLTGALGLVIERILRPLESKDLNLMLIGTIGFGIVLESLAILVWGSFGDRSAVAQASGSVYTTETSRSFMKRASEMRKSTRLRFD